MAMHWKDLPPTDVSAPVFAWTDLPAGVETPRRKAAEPVSKVKASELGLPLQASPEELKAAYRACVRRMHPDVVPPAERAAAEERMKALNAAYRKLTEAAETRAMVAAR